MLLIFFFKKMLSLTEEDLRLQQYSTICYICRKAFTQKLAKNKNYQKLRDHCHFNGKYRGSVHCICNLKFNLTNKIPEAFHNASSYDYHFIIKELANTFKG